MASSAASNRSDSDDQFELGLPEVEHFPSMTWLAMDFDAAPASSDRWSPRKSVIFVVAICGGFWSAVAVLIALFA